MVTGLALLGAGSTLSNASVDAPADTASKDAVRRSNGEPLQLSLFEPVYEEEFNGQERNIAVHLDEERTIRWWHRNVARKQYALQGWRRECVYPDFIFALNAGGDTQRIAVVETKGEHLEGNDDSEYKRELFRTLTEFFQGDHTAEKAKTIGVIELSRVGRTSVMFEMITLSQWQTEIARIIHGD